MANEKFISCLLDPELIIEPGSIAGPGGDVTISFQATTVGCDDLDVRYQIYGVPPTAYEFTELPKRSNQHRAEKKRVDERTMTTRFQVESRSETTADYGLGKFGIGRVGPDKGEAALKIVVKVIASGPGGYLGEEPTFSAQMKSFKGARVAVGSLAVLSGGLQQMMEEQDVLDVPGLLRKFKRLFPTLPQPTTAELQEVLAGADVETRVRNKIDPFLSIMRSEVLGRLKGDSTYKKTLGQRDSSSA